MVGQQNVEFSLKVLQKFLLVKLRSKRGSSNIVRQAPNNISITSNPHDAETDF
jgi:hypothetical protein